MKDHVSSFLMGVRLSALASAAMYEELCPVGRFLVVRRAANLARIRTDTHVTSR